MKQKKPSLFRRFAITILSLTTVLGVLFIFITYFSITYYHEANMQLLNKEVAAHIAKFTSPFEGERINTKKADSVFYNAMVISPSAEIYFLDTVGKVVAFHASDKEIREWHIALDPIKKYIATGGEKYIKGPDPKDPGHSKIFSAAEVHNGGKDVGYIYVILESKRSEGIMNVLLGGHLLNLGIKAAIVIVVLSLVLSLLYLRRLRRNYGQIISVLERFESGDYEARFSAKQKNELEPVTQAFNKMADLLSTTINKLTTSEQERKNFIAIISHDLRTPLAIARGYTETLLLKREKGDISMEEQEHYSQLIYSKMLQIENMVKQLFELSKMEAVEFTPKREPFVLAEIVQEVVNNFQLMAKGKNVDLKCTQCLYHVWVNADIGMMERVIQNLVDNAVKGTPGHGSVEVSIAVQNSNLLFRIENDGAPLPDDLVRWINDFGRESALPANRPRKTGLGLLIVQKILQLHHTQLSAGTGNGKNHFTFAIPVYNLPA